MTFQRPGLCLLLAASLSTSGVAGASDDWPQWRGKRGAAAVSDFTPPASWPESLVQKWKVVVGDGVSTPALVGDRLYVFSREGGNEVLRCLELADGSEVWQASIPAAAFRGPDGSFPGPRCSPAVADGKVVVVGVHGYVACFDAAGGKELWRNSEFEGKFPMFHTSSSPVLFGNQCIIQLGGGDGGIVCLNLADGSEAWRWIGQGPDYASPTIAEIDDDAVVFAATKGKAVALNARTGNLMWEMDYTQGRYNSTSPVVHNKQLILAGPNRGITALNVSIDGDKLSVDEAWRNDESSMMYNTPVIKGDNLFGLTASDQLFCVDLGSGRTVWTAGGTSPAPDRGGGERPSADRGERPERPANPNVERGGGERGERGGPPGRGGRGGRGGGGRGGYGSVVDAGAVLFTLSPSGQLNVVAPDAAEHKQLATYKVAQEKAYAYPIVAGQQIIVKDADSVTVWSLQ